MTPMENIIEPSEHPIRPDMLDDEALYVMRKLNRAGFSSYLVGGGVRDLYLGKKASFTAWRPDWKVLSISEPRFP